MVTSSFWLWAAQRSFYLKHVRVSTVRRATVVKKSEGVMDANYWYAKMKKDIAEREHKKVTFA